MTNQSTNAGAAEVTAIDTHARWPLLYLIGAGLVWLIVSGVLSLIAAIQLHSPAYLAECAWFTHGRVEAMRETAFIYGWAANAGLAIGTWLLGRLGGYPLRGLNWFVVGGVFWNLAVAAGLIGIAAGEMTSFAVLQLPRAVQPLLVLSYAATAISGVLAWSGRKRAGTFASQWYAVAALFLFPWFLTATQVVLLWTPVRGVVQAVAAAWYAEGVFALWLAPLALAGAYYVVPKVSGRTLPSYEAAPVAFWTLIVVGTWTAGRHLVGGPVPAWLPTMGVVGTSLLLFHFLVLAFNFKIALTPAGTAMNFLRFGLLAYLLYGVFTTIASFRGVAAHAQFTFVTVALEQLGFYGAVSMLFFGTLYYMVPRLTGRDWALPGLASAHFVTASTGLVLALVALAVAGETQGNLLLEAKATYAEIFQQVSVPLMIHTAAQFLLIAANLLLLVNFAMSAWACGEKACASAAGLLRSSSSMEASAS
ncbi:MAG: cbb3-type cytochrome c oxidase subunit I [Verrucomicrobia bacterium]|nr:cbb3-type cytochrome c oxidase subunit I [Verrucomicrobiota bacterium]